MSAAAEEDEVMMFCASCGIAGGDDIKLKDCSACHLVQYCSVECQDDHRPQHEEECKKRAAELKDESLFKQPEGTCYGDCPICYLPIPIDESDSVLMACCGKRICEGCNLAKKMREIEGRLQQKCPFCRTAVPSSDEEINEQLMKRIEVNDPVAMCLMGVKRHCQGDFEATYEYFTKAASLGDVEAHYQSSVMYQYGQGVEKDEKMELYHLEQAAIGGHPEARHNLGCVEWEDGQYDRAAKHFIIAAKLGCNNSLKHAERLYIAGHVSEEEFAALLRGHKAAIDATKSPQREKAAEYERRNSSFVMY